VEPIEVRTLSMSSGPMSTSTFDRGCYESTMAWYVMACNSSILNG